MIHLMESSLGFGTTPSSLHQVMDTSHAMRTISSSMIGKTESGCCALKILDLSSVAASRLHWPLPGLPVCQAADIEPAL